MWGATAALGLLASSCKSYINDSPGIRWWLFSNFGASKMCPEMLKRGAAPLKLDPNGNVIGRFYPNTCRHVINEQNQTVSIEFAGTGYAWTPVAGRIGFACNATIEYRPDFYLADDALYAFAHTNRIIDGPAFQIGSVENKVLDMATQSPLGYLTNTFGSQIVSSQLSSGFTVVRTDEGDEFTLGILRPPARPKKPFALPEGDRIVYANETTEVRSNQLDFLGPFEVGDDDQALFVRMLVQSGPGVDVLVMREGAANLWRDALQRGSTLGAPPEPPLFGFVAQPNQQVMQRVPLPRGLYFLVIDNSGAVGQVAPPWSPLALAGANVAVVSYTSELGERDDGF